MEKRLANGNNDDFGRIEKDRQEINAAYDNGFSNEIIDMELNTPDLLDRVDKYGFIHPKKLPPQLSDVEQKRNNIEKLREIKWRSMVKDWEKHCVLSKHRYSEKLISRVFKGIPNSMRNVAWYKILDIENQIKSQSGVYEKMKYFARKYSLELRQIDLDINRTFRNNYAYKKRYCQRQRQLYNVLAAYSVYNTEIGYCQGMSTLTALLLMYLSDEEQTFWALCQLMTNTKYSMHGLFKSGFPKLIRFSDKHEMIIKTLLPKIYKKFIKCNITPLIYTTKWFLQCFLDALPFSLVLRVWDVYLLKGDITILAMSYCILKMHKRTLLQKDFDMDKINEFLNHKLPENFLFSDDLVMEKLNECIEKLLRFKFESLILEPIPINELPSLPFGDLKLMNNQEYLNKMSEKKTKFSKIEEDRDEQLKQLAKTRLEKEKMKREERRRKFLEEKGKLEEGKINFDTDDDDSDEELESDDDLNPSKLSEYDDDKDVESMISNMTRQSSPHRSINSVDIQTNKINSKNSRSSNSFTNQLSDYENLQDQKISFLNVKTSPLKHSSNSLNKSSPKSLNNKTTSSSSSALASYIISPNSQTNGSSYNSKGYLNNATSIVSIPFISEGTFDNINSDSSNIARIKTNPGYYNKSMSRILSTGKINEFIRSPHGIYTRVNVPPNYKSFIAPPSISQNKRTASLRGPQKSLIQSSEFSKTAESYNSSIQQNIQNHSLRISIIQQQNEKKNHCKNYSLTNAQLPNNELISKIDKPDFTPDTSKKILQTQDLIEECDYI